MNAPMKNISNAAIELAEQQIIEVSKKIDFFTVDFSVELLVTKLQSGDFYIPGYQRELVWDEPRRCRFIESLIMGLPIPFLFFWENKQTGSLEVVDGSQRLRTLRQFLEGKLVLNNLSKLGYLQDLTFNDLPESRQRKIRNCPIRGIILNEHADADTRFELFDRINTSSKMAEPS